MQWNKTVIECWNILKYETDSITEQFVPLRKQGKQSRNICPKKLLKNSVQSNYVDGLCSVDNINIMFF